MSNCTFLELLLFKLVTYSLNYTILVCPVSVIEYILLIYLVGKGPHPLSICLHNHLEQISCIVTRLTICGFLKTIQPAWTMQVGISETCIIKKNPQMGELLTVQAVCASGLCKKELQ